MGVREVLNISIGNVVIVPPASAAKPSSTTLMTSSGVNTYSKSRWEKSLRRVEGPGLDIGQVKTA